jgi:hypothetical protein
VVAAAARAWPESGPRRLRPSLAAQDAKHQGVQPADDVAGNAAELDLELDRLALGRLDQAGPPRAHGAWAPFDRLVYWCVRQHASSFDTLSPQLMHFQADKLVAMSGETDGD